MSSADIRLKTPDDIKRIREAGIICAEVFRCIESLSMEGMSTWELDSLVDAVINRAGARSAFKTLHGYNYCSCISVNDEIAHGIPSRKRYIAAGDLVKVDVGVVFRGYFADACRSFPVKGASREIISLAEVPRRALLAALAVIRAGEYVEGIGNVIEGVVESATLNVIPGLTGHGVGFALHEAPKVPHYRESGQRVLMREGLVLAIEPAVTGGNGRIVKDSNEFTIRTADGAWASQYEETVALTGNGPLLLTS